MQVLRAAVLLILGILLPVAAHAQATDGSIAGTATDVQGAALPNVSVTVRNTESGTSRTTVTGPDGHYLIAALPTGTYDLVAQHDGFEKSEVKGIVVTVNLEYESNLALKTGAVDQTVSVTAQRPLVDTTSNEVGSAIISQDQVDNLPIPGRQATQLSLLLPTTGTDTTRAQRPDANVGLGDQNVAATTYLVDGLTNMISGAGDPRDNIQQASVQEFQVIISQAPAEYGGRSGGVVSLVTKGGTNNFHGEAFEFFRDHYINRVDYFTQRQHDSDPTLYPIQPFNRNQLGGAFGGPILKDRLHFFGSYEYLNDKEYFTVAPGGAAPPMCQNGGQTVLCYGSQQGGFRTGSFQNSYFGRIDWQIDPKNNAFIHFFEQTPSMFYCLSCTGGNSSNFSTGDTGVPSYTYAAGETWVITPKIVNQVALQIGQYKQTSLPSHFYTPSQQVLNNANFIESIAGDVPAGVPIFPTGTTSFSFPNFKWGFYPGVQFHPFTQEAFDDLTITHNRHTFKFGADVLNQPRDLQASSTPLGAWTFADDIYFNPTDPNFNWASLANAVPTKFTSTFPTIPYRNYNVETSIYAEDEWKLKPNLTLNLGVRYDLQSRVWLNKLNASLYPSPGLPPFVTFGGHGVHDNVAPRVGFAWDPKGNGKTVFRGGYGIVYTMNSNNVYGEGETVTLRQHSVLVSGSAAKPISFPDPYGGKGYLNYLTTTSPSVTVDANQVSNPPVYTYSLGGTRQISHDFAVIVDGFYSKMTKFQITPNVNTPAESSQGVNITPLTRPYPAYTNISEVLSEGNFEYKALAVRLDKRYSRHFEATLSYTLAKQRDNYNNSGSWTDFYYPQEDKGAAAADRRNMLVLSSYTRLPWRITVGAIYTARSSLPLVAETGADNNNDGATDDYVPGTTKNEHSAANLLRQVNAWRATQTTTVTIGGVKTTVPLGNLPLSQIETSFYNQLDMHINKDIRLTERYKIEVIGQLFNVFGTDNFGGVGSSEASNASALSATSSYAAYATSTSTFGTISAALPRQQGELAVRLIF